ncbi:cysteine methyltransferase, partial [Streptomyces sp. NPDC059037]
MNANGQDTQGQEGRQRVVWAVVASDIGPLLLAATDEGLVTVVFHATDAVRDKALDRLGSRQGSRPVAGPRTPHPAAPQTPHAAHNAGA